MKTKRKFLFLLLLMTAVYGVHHDVIAFAQQAPKNIIKRYAKIVEPDSVCINKIDSLYSSKLNMLDTMSRNIIEEYYGSLEVAQQIRLDSLMMDKIDSYLISGNNDMALFEADKFLSVVTENNMNRGNVLYVCGQILLSKQEWRKLNYVIKDMRTFSILSEIDMSQEIDELQEALDTASDYVPIEQDIVGFWVSDLCDSNRTMIPEMALKITSPTDPGGAELYRGVSFYSKMRSVFPDILAQSQQFDLNGPMDSFEIYFCNREVRQGSESTANLFFDQAQKMQASVSSTISTSPNIKFGDAMLATGVGAVLSSLFIFAGQQASLSTAKIGILKISGTRISPGIMRTECAYDANQATSENIQKNLGGWNSEYQFMKVDPEDSIEFSTLKGIAISGETVAADNPATSELFAINRRYKFYQPRYLVPMLECVALGTTLAVVGIKRSTESDAVGPIIYGGLGIYLAIASPFVTNGIRRIGKRRAIRQYNQNCYDRLYDKYEKELSVIPIYDYNTKSAGVGLSLSF